jgi:SAM-dependent methyltransferase
MHRSSYLRMEWFERKYASNVSSKKQKILDVGSFDVNGTYKDIFPLEHYIYEGLDMEEGPNVDIVPKNPYSWKEIKKDEYDIVISGQAFEHIEFFWITLSEMVRVLKKDGLMCIIAPNGFKEHRYPVDCYRFFADGMVALAKYYKMNLLHAHTNRAENANPEWYSDSKADSMLVAVKPYTGKPKKINLKKYECIPADHNELSGELI